MAMKVTVEPTAYPITLEDLKTYLRVDGNDEDAQIESILAAAVKWSEKACRRQWMQATYALSLDHFPCGRVIRPIVSPLSSVTSIAYVDADGNNQTLDSAQYRVDTVSEPGRIELDTAYTWPTTDDRLNAVTITIVAGYASAAAVPAEAKHLVKFVAAHWYEHRGPIDIDRDAKEMPLAVQSLKALLTVPEFH